MTAPKDAPRPTSELVKWLLERADRLEDGMFERAVLPPEIELMREAAASLQALEARNKELEGALNKIARTPAMPFPDAGAHSWEVFAKAVHRAWCDIQRTASSALRPNTGEK